MILPPEKYPFELKKGMSVREVEDCVKAMMGLTWEHYDVNTITIYDVPFGIDRLCDLVCKFKLDGNLYDIYYYEVSP